MRTAVILLVLTLVAGVTIPALADDLRLRTPDTSTTTQLGILYEKPAVENAFLKALPDVYELTVSSDIEDLANNDFKNGLFNGCNIKMLYRIF